MLPKEVPSARASVKRLNCHRCILVVTRSTGPREDHCAGVCSRFALNSRCVPCELPEIGTIDDGKHVGADKKTCGK